LAAAFLAAGFAFVFFELTFFLAMTGV
jgi:hypothetical protein